MRRHHRSLLVTMLNLPLFAIMSWIDLVCPQGMEAHRRQFRGGGSITCPDYILFSSSFLLQQKLQQDDVSIGDGVFDCFAQALSAEKQSTPGQSKLSTRL